MNKLVFECETITPMFLAGADGKTPELRAPSIKGALRFWWRAMNSGQSNLLEEECNLFGGSSEKAGRSKIIVKTKEINKSIKINLKDLVWNFNAKRPKSGYEGFSYLLYSTFMQRGREKPYFEKLNFKVDLQAKDKEDLKKVGYIFWIFSNLGGIGTRARRGGGNFYVKNFEDPDNILKDISFINKNTESNFKKYLEENFTKIKSLFSLTENNNYSNLGNARLFYIPSVDNPIKGLNSLGLKFQEFRSHMQPDYDTVKTYLRNGNIDNSIEKASFGLPLSYRYNSLPTSDNQKKSALIEGSKEDFQRSASPILFRIVKFRENYYPLILIFDKNLLPDGIGLKIKENTSKTRDRKQRPAITNQPSGKIIDEFIKSIKDKMEVLI